MKVKANGKTFTFPDGTSPEDIGVALDEYFAQQGTPAAEKPREQSLMPERNKPGYLTRMQNVGKETLSNMGTHEGMQPQANNIPDDIAAKFGEANYGNDPASRTREFLSEGISGASQAITDTVLTGASEDASQWVKDRAQDVMQSKPVQAVAGAVQDFSEAHPNEAKALGETLNIATALGVPKAKAPSVPLVNRATKALKKGEAAGVKRTRVKKTKELMTPDKESAAPGTLTKDKRGNKIYEPTNYEQKVINELVETPGFNPNKPAVHNNAIVNNRLDELRENLDNYIVKTKKNPKYDQARLEELFDEARDAVAGRRLIKNTPIGQTAEDMIDYMRELIDGDTAMDLLNARRTFDADVRKQLGELVFNPDVDSAANIAMNEVRKVINQLVDESVPGKNVLKSLEKQHLLYKAQSHLRKKAWEEADTFYGKLTEAVYRKTGISLPTTPLATYATVATPVMAAAGQPAIAGAMAAGLASWAGFKGGKWLMTTPAGRTWLYQQIQNFGKNPMLKTERAQLIALYEEIAKTPVEKEEE